MTGLRFVKATLPSLSEYFSGICELFTHMVVGACGVSFGCDTGTVHGEIGLCLITWNPS